jgi:anaerobic magnesium-protoporphyrin IX monomethyl ester cyclase
MMQKVLLIVPPFKILKEGKGSTINLKKYGNHIPLGIAILASVVEKDGHEVNIIDSAAEDLTVIQIIHKIKNLGPTIIGITATTASKKSAYKVAKEIKRNFSVPIILGGPHAMAFAGDIFNECDAFDYLCISEGEIVIKNLIEVISGNRKIETVDGIVYKKNNEIRENLTFPIIKDLDDLPLPAYHKFDLSLYKALPKQVKRRPSIPYITSRGCYYRRCTFCFQAGKNGQSYRRMSPERVIFDIKYLIDTFKVKDITFWDDNFLINNRWLSQFAELLKENNIDITWSCYGKVDTVNEASLVKLKGVGLWNIFFGFETGNQLLLNEIKKGITLAQSRKAAEICNRLGIDIRGSFMLALPGSTPEIDKQTVEFAKQLDLSYAQFHLTYPEFGTQLYDIALDKGQIQNDIEFKGRTSAVYIPQGYHNVKEVEKISKWAYLRFYFRLNYLMKHIRKIRSFHDLREYMFGALFVLGIVIGIIIRKSSGSVDTTGK